MPRRLVRRWDDRAVGRFRVVLRRSSATALFAALLAGCTSAPKVDSFALPHYAYVPLRDSGIEDRRSSFASVFCAVLRSNLEPDFAERSCTEFLHIDGEFASLDTRPALDPGLPLRVIFVPGFLGDCLARYTTPFEKARTLLQAEGLQSELLLVGGRSSSAHNAGLIAERINSEELRQGPPVVLIGYSKGLADVLEALHLVDGLDHVAAVVGVAGVVNGSPLADEQSSFMRDVIDRLPLSGCPRSAANGDAIESLSYEYRQDWLDRHPLRPGPRYVSIAAYGSLAEMSRVNQATYRKLSQIDGRNDGQIIYRDALIPNSTLLAFVRADHLAVALPIDADDGALANHLVDRNAFPRAVLLKSVLIAVQQLLSP